MTDFGPLCRYGEHPKSGQVMTKLGRSHSLQCASGTEASSRSAIEVAQEKIEIFVPDDIEGIHLNPRLAYERSQRPVLM